MIIDQKPDYQNEQKPQRAHVIPTRGNFIEVNPLLIYSHLSIQSKTNSKTSPV